MSEWLRGLNFSGNFFSLHLSQEGKERERERDGKNFEQEERGLEPFLP